MQATPPIWDERIDTSQDAPLLRMDVRNRSWSTTVRILAVRNIVLVDGGRPITLEEVKANELPSAKLGSNKLVAS
jgi:hypothetical protein